MTEILEVTHDDIKRLDAAELHRLLDALLDNELKANDIPSRASSVMLDPTISDGGEDGLVSWMGEPPNTTWIPFRRTLFQSKSGSSFSGFVSELFERPSNRKILKPRIKENFDAGGSYVFFCGGRTFSRTAKNKAIADVRSVLQPFYDSVPEIDVYDCRDIKNWTNQYLPAVSLVFSLVHKTGLDTFATWDKWARFQGHETEFVSNDQADINIHRIRASFVGERIVERLVGLPGLGKTRIALEAFRAPLHPKDDPAQASLSGSAVYVMANEEPDLVSKTAQLQMRGVSGTLIVDNCEEGLHTALSRHVQHPDSRLNLLTLDFHVHDTRESLEAGVFQIGSSPPDTIREILRTYHPTLSEHDLEVIVKYADGFPKIAALLRIEPLEEDVQLGPLTDKDLTKRLLWGRNPEDGAFRIVVEACSLFIHLGFTGSFRYQRDYVAERICHIKTEEFYRRADFFKGRGVLDQIGDFVRVSPLPLAIRLSEGWWSSNDPDYEQGLFDDPNMPPDLKEALGKQFTKLSGVEQAEEIARRLQGPSAPFGRAEVLNTRQGSEVFRSLAEVNPDVAAETLSREFGSMSAGELREHVGPGRRSLIWALEVIVFHERLFRQAAALLARFAIAENENISNNATGQYLHLFQPLLAGTEAGPTLRIAEIDRSLSSDDPAQIKLAVRALGRAISNRGSGRVLGAETQGRTVLKDWCPTTYGDLFWYFDAAVERLTVLAIREDDIGDMARKRLGESIRFLLSYGRVDTIEKAVAAVTRGYKRAWPEALEGVRNALRFELKSVDLEAPDVRELLGRVHALLELLQPEEESELLRIIVSIPTYGNLEPTETGVYIDLNQLAVNKIAESYADAPEKWLRAVKLLSRGEQRQGFNFGSKVGQLLNVSFDENYVNAAFLALEEEKNEGNPALLCGLLAAIRPRNPDLIERTLDRIADSKYAFNYVVYFTAWTQPEERDLDRITALLQEGRLKPDAYRGFIGGRVLGALKPETVREFLRPLLSYGAGGAMAALQIAFMYVKSAEEHDAFAPFFKQLVMLSGLLAWPTTDTMDTFALQETIKRLLQSSHDEAMLARHTTLEIIAACKDRKLNLPAYEIMQALAVTLLETYPSVTWPLIKEALQDADALTEFHLLFVMKRNLTMAQGPKSAFLLLSDDDLTAWCREQPQLAPRLILGSIPLFSYDGETVAVPSLVEKLVAAYGSDRHVLSAMSSNLESFSNVGSFVPAYEQRLEFVQHFVGSPVPEVAAWASTYSSAYRDRVKSQQKRDQEHSEGILTPFYADELPPSERPIEE